MLQDTNFFYFPGERVHRSPPHWGVFHNTKVPEHSPRPHTKWNSGYTTVLTQTYLSFVSPSILTLNRVHKLQGEFNLKWFAFAPDNLTHLCVVFSAFSKQPQYINQLSTVVRVWNRNMLWSPAGIAQATLWKHSLYKGCSWQGGNKAKATPSLQTLLLWLREFHNKPMVNRLIPGPLIPWQ